MIFAAYAIYAFLLAAALWRSRGGSMWRTSAAFMLLLPVVVAAGITWYAIETQRGAAAVLFVLPPGLWLYVVGLQPLIRLAPLTRWTARTAGWSLIAWITLIPATTVLLAPISGLLAFVTVGITRNPASRSDAPECTRSSVVRARRAN